jgi:hypothetical protein
LLTGRVPFEGENFVTVAMKHINEPAPNIASRRGDVSPRLAAAVDRALAKNPRDRFPTMDAFAAELETCLAELRPGDSQRTFVNVPPSASVRRRMHARRRAAPGPLLVALLALAAIAVIVVAAIAVHGNHSLIPGVSAKKGGGGGIAVTLSATSGYDPQGDGAEHDGDARFATDGNQSTFWRTEHYANQSFGGLKTGVGLVLTASGVRSVGTLTVTSDTPGFSAVVKAGSSPESAQTVSDSKVVEGSTTFDLHNAKGPVFVLWITSLPPGAAAHVNEVTAKG